MSAEKVAAARKPCRFAPGGHTDADIIIDYTLTKGLLSARQRRDGRPLQFSRRRRSAPVLTVDTNETKERCLRPDAEAHPGSISILHAEDGPEVSETVRELLEAEGWHVVVCPRGDDALRELQGGHHFDLLIFDHMLPGLDGVELTRRARKLRGRSSTPVIMLTSSEVEREARRAGVDIFLRKPEGVVSITEAAARLLASVGRL